jgi:hypothetical protein
MDRADARTVTSLGDVAFFAIAIALVPVMIWVIGSGIGGLSGGQK